MRVLFVEMLFTHELFWSWYSVVCLDKGQCQTSAHVSIYAYRYTVRSRNCLCKWTNTMQHNTNSQIWVIVPGLSTNSYTTSPRHISIYSDCGLRNSTYNSIAYIHECYRNKHPLYCLRLQNSHEAL